MRVSVHQRGGLMGLDKLVEVDGSGVRVSEKGVVRKQGVLDEPAQAALQELAAQARDDAPVAAAGGLVYDAMSTDIEIEEDGAVTAISVRSGDDVPSHVLALIKAVTAAPRQAKPA